VLARWAPKQRRRLGLQLTSGLLAIALGCTALAQTSATGPAQTPAQPNLSNPPAKPSPSSTPATASSISAPSLALGGRMGAKALVVIDGRTVVLAVGQSEQGVKLLRWDQEVAVVERAGAQFRLVAGAPARTVAGAAASGGDEIVIPVGPGGHFVANGAINGRVTRFVVDTGATSIAMSRDEAERLGLDLSQGTPVPISTAGGNVMGRALVLRSVRLGDVEVHNVQAVVTPAPMPFVLLGNSFLGRFQMRRDSDVMRLTRR
jgi:aspartyl protease family protein